MEMISSISCVPPSGTGFNPTGYQIVQPKTDVDTKYIVLNTSSNSAGHSTLSPDKFLLRDLGEGFKTLKPIPVTVEHSDGFFTAAFVGANISIPGDTWSDAVISLKYLVIDMFKNLLSHEPSRLGPGPKRQLAVLQSFIKPIEHAQ